jgi:hypothetical protein
MNILEKIDSYLNEKEGWVVFGSIKKEYLTQFSFDGKTQLGWSKDKKKAKVFPDSGSAEKALDMTLTDKYGYVKRLNEAIEKSTMYGLA